jgi:hypothetical protein
MGKGHPTSQIPFSVALGIEIKEMDAQLALNSFFETRLDYDLKL